MTQSPFEDKLVQNLEVMNESFTLILMYHVLALNTNWITDTHARDWVGCSLIVVIAINVFINFFFLFRTIAQKK